MAQKRLGLVVSAPDSAAVLRSIAELEQQGILAAWLTSAGAGGADPLGVLAGAALQTQHIMLGTAITQTFPRHPIAVVQQALVLAQLAPGRFRLGLGTSGRAGMEQTFGVNFRAPLGHLRDYLRIVKALLQEGAVDFSGRYYQGHSRISAPVDMPVMAAALGEKAYELCGAEADGAISWVCPGSVADAIEGLFELGATEILVSLVAVGEDPVASRARTLRLLSQLSQSDTYS